MGSSVGRIQLTLGVMRRAPVRLRVDSAIGAERVDYLLTGILTIGAKLHS
jgi:hypothetical protein